MTIKRSGSKRSKASISRTAPATDVDIEALDAQLVLTPSLLGGLTIADLTPKAAALNPSKLAAALDKQSDAVNRGDLGGLENILTVQAYTLNLMFNRLTQRAVANMGEHFPAFEAYLRLALKAQSQCRTTIETVAAVKNPAPIAFVRQANISAGLQQVNNSAGSVNQVPRAREFEILPSKLLEKNHGKRLDAGAAATASGGNQELETMGEIHRSQYARRKGAGRA